MAYHVKFLKFYYCLCIYSGSYRRLEKILTMYDKENIIKDLYNGLEKLRYPEVAQINYEEFESTILTGNKRVELLYWLLQENQNFNCNLLNKFKESSLQGKLLKCYSQMGFCNSEDILLGKCKIDEQLHFLSLLSLFIKRIYSAESESLKGDKENVNSLTAESESLKNDKENVNSLIKADIVSVSFSADCGGGEKSNFKNQNSSPEGLKSLEPCSNVIDERKSDLENICCNIKSILDESNKHQNDNYEPKLQKFYTSFKNVTSLPFKSCHFNNSSDNLNTDVEQIHATFSTINKALINQVEFNNRPIAAENNEKMTRPLSLIISNNVVLIEQACNMLKENRM